MSLYLFIFQKFTEDFSINFVQYRVYTGCVRKNGLISSDRYTMMGGRCREGGRPLGRRENAVSVGNMEWSGAQRAFVVETF
jgi:hypothetical protein